jgi:hypothetical protein
MQRRKACLVLAAVALTLVLPLSAPKATAAGFTAEPAPPDWLVGTTPKPRPMTCYIWQGTRYFSDASLTTQIGLCTITCNQAMYGTVEPTFSGGGTCTGSPSDFTVRTSYGCPGICW